MVQKRLIFKLLLVLIVIMLAVNAYTLFLFIRGVSQTEGFDSYFYNDVKGFNDEHIYFNISVPSIRFKVSPEDDRVRILVPGDGDGPSQSDEMKIIAQRIRYNLLEMSHKSKYNRKASLQSVSRLKRILKKSGLTAKDQRAEAHVIWKGISGWPFSDALRLLNLGEVITLANSAKILETRDSRRGTQLKVEMTLEGGQVALYKPEWYPRGIRINGTTYSGKDRHFGEIAAFYLNLILGYNNGPVIVGRRVNLAKDIYSVASPELGDTFFKAHNGSLCFYGKCHYCNKDDPVCSTGDEMEGALVLLLDRKFKTLPNPWRRTYKIGSPAPWELSMDYCQRVMKDKSPAKRLESLLDVVAVSIFDFLIGNGDRHHFEMFWQTEPNSRSHSNKIILMDNGKSFGNSEEDYIDILAPLFQCCKIRDGLYSSLKKFEGVLGKSVDSISEVDALYPLLTRSHLRALDRRLSIVLATVQLCLDNQNQQRNHPPRKVIYS